MIIQAYTDYPECMERSARDKDVPTMIVTTEVSGLSVEKRAKSLVKKLGVTEATIVDGKQVFGKFGNFQFHLNLKFIGLRENFYRVGTIVKL
jgi:hypothetical protein